MTRGPEEDAGVRIVEAINQSVAVPHHQSSKVSGVFEKWKASLALLKIPLASRAHGVFDIYSLLSKRNENENGIQKLAF